MKTSRALLLLCCLLLPCAAEARQASLHGAVLLNDNTSLAPELCAGTPLTICAPCDAAELTTLLHVRNASWNRGRYTVEGRNAAGEILFALPDVPLGPRDVQSWNLGRPLWSGLPFVGEAVAFVTADVPLDVTVEYLSGGEDEARDLGAQFPMRSTTASLWRSHTAYVSTFPGGPAQHGSLYLVNPDPVRPASGQVRFIPPTGGVNPGTGGPAFAACLPFSDVPPMGFVRLDLSVVAGLDPAAGWIEVSTEDALDLGPACSPQDTVQGSVTPLLLSRVGTSLDVLAGRCPAGGGLAAPSYVEPFDALSPASVR